MTEPIRLFDGRLQIAPAITPVTANTLGLTDSLSNVSQRATAPSNDLFDARPGVRLELGTSAATGVGADSILRGVDRGTALGSAPSLGGAAALLADPLMNRTPSAGADVRFELSHTLPTQANGISTTMTVRVDAAAAVAVTGTESLMRELGPLFNDAAAFEASARTAASALASELAYFQSGAEVQALRSAIATQNRELIVAAAVPVLGHLAETERTLRSLGGVFDQANELISRIEAAPSTLLGTATARGSVEIDRTVRFPIASARRGPVTARLSGAVSASVIAPIDAPSALPAVPGMAPLRTLMTAVSVIARASTSDLDDLRTLISDARALTDSARTLVTEARTTPLRYQNAAEANRAQNTITELSTRGAELTQRASVVADALSGRLEAGARVVQATGPGAGLRAAGLRLEGTIGEHVAFSGSLTLRNLIGFVPGETSDYALVQADDGSFMLGQLGSTRTENVFHRFYPGGAAFDASLTVRGGASSVELRGGVDGTAAGTSAYVGLVTRIHAFYLATSLVIPDIHHPNVLPPQFLLGLGVDARPFSLVFSAGADAAILGGDVTAARGAHGSLSLSVHF